MATSPLKGNVLALHVDDAPDASISSGGDWSVNGKTVSISPLQRGLLMLYYQNVKHIRQQSVEMGKAGVEEGAKAINNSMDESKSNKKQKNYNGTSARVNQLLLKMCQDQVNLKTIQDQLVIQIPSFKPYGNIFASSSIDDCMKEDED